MKWKNKGHEFDEIGKKFIEKNKIIVVCPDEQRNFIQKKLDFLDSYVSYINIEYLKNIFKSKKHVFELFNKYFIKNTTFIFSDSYLSHISEFETFIENTNIFMLNDFLEKYLSIFAVYLEDKVYFKDISFICTTICSLNCRDCLNFQPFIKNPHHMPIEQLKNDIDIFFSCIDRLGMFNISGGEPFLYPYLKELIQYLYDNYRNKIEEISITTNGTVLLTDDFFEMLKDKKIMIYQDDYRENVLQTRKTLPKIIEKYERYSVDFCLVDRHDFFQLFPPKNIMNNVTPEKLICKFNKCAIPFTQLTDGKLYNCNWSNFAKIAGLFSSKKDEFYDLKTLNKNMKKELVEYRNGYSTKGYVEFCEYCNGNLPINSVFVPGAIQTKGLLYWDKKNPLEVKVSEDKIDE